MSKGCAAYVLIFILGIPPEKFSALGWAYSRFRLCSRRAGSVPTLPAVLRAGSGTSETGRPVCYCYGHKGGRQLSRVLSTRCPPYKPGSGFGPQSPIRT